MLGYYKKHIFTLAESVEKLRKNTDDLDLLIDTQLYILKRILITEKQKSEYRANIADFKRNLRQGRMPKQAAVKLKRHLHKLRNRVDACQKMLYIWRCFGDAIAFSYLDKWAIKQLYFDTKSTDVKQSAGHIGGKDGLQNELALVVEAKKNGVPALLTDITNTIRHGDVCLLGASDPYVIEVKSSSNRNERVTRQSESIKEIHSFLENDGAQNLRGLPGYCKRVEFSLPELNYIGIVNEMICEASKCGYSQRTAEPGIHYFAFSTKYRPDYSAMFKQISRPNIYMLNVAKNEQTWGCCYPFTLSIRKPESLYAFLHGDIFILVVLDDAEMSRVAQDMGITIRFLDDDSFAYEFEEFGNGSANPISCKVSRNFALRIAFEFLSWNWVLATHQQQLGRIKDIERDDSSPTN